HVAAGQRLCHSDDVGLHALVFVSEELAATADTALHFVADQECIVLPKFTLRIREKTSGRDMNAFSLDGFDQQRGDVALLQFAAKAVQIAESDGGVRQQRAEAFAELAGAVNGKGASC